MEAIIIAAILLTGLVLYVYAVVDIHRHKFPNLREKSLWVNIVNFLPVAGPLLYFLFYKKQYARQRRLLKS